MQRLVPIASQIEQIEVTLLPDPSAQTEQNARSEALGRTERNVLIGQTGRNAPTDRKRGRIEMFDPTGRSGRSDLAQKRDRRPGRLGRKVARRFDQNHGRIDQNNRASSGRGSSSRGRSNHGQNVRDRALNALRREQNAHSLKQNVLARERSGRLPVLSGPKLEWNDRNRESSDRNPRPASNDPSRVLNALNRGSPSARRVPPRG
jgi:hypothetical protein